MGLNRDKWKEEFRAGEPLRWPCPACRESPLRLVVDSIKKGETAASKSMHGHLAFELDLHTEGRFSSIMDCAHCRNEVAVAGTYRLKDERAEDAEHGEAGGYVEYYRPKCGIRMSAKTLPTS